ncbi:MAG: PVC-type heme-binding CxxCH protein, partial [Planctomycetota bacterium]
MKLTVRLPLPDFAKGSLPLVTSMFYSFLSRLAPGRYMRALVSSVSALGLCWGLAVGQDAPMPASKTHSLVKTSALDSEDRFPEPDDTEPLAIPGNENPGDLEQGPPRPSPAEAARQLKLPTGFDATVFAAEPEVRNPIDLAWDHQGRLWIAENYTYGRREVHFRDDLRDRVVVFEDADLDGTPESRRVFLDTVTKLTSVEVGRGGVWLMCPPQLLFVPDADHDAVPDGPVQVKLDGFKVAEANYHNFANGLRFGPDGWLYGRCGGSCPGMVGRPGTSGRQRVALEGGIWRYNVDTEHFEVLCHGTTNPWGHDFTDTGELFFINTVNGHLWHGIEGAHFKRPFTLDPNPLAYELIDQHADHYHFDTTGSWTKSRGGAANDFGGGHAHCGMMIYRESTWPEEYRGELFTLNFHGRRANQEHLHPQGSGFVGQHRPDFFISDDTWFRGMELSAGPDGNVMVLDWSDLGECHEHTGVHRNSGRIFKISYPSTNARQRAMEDLETLKQGDPAALVALLASDRRWFAHQARLELTQGVAEGRWPREEVAPLLRSRLDLSAAARDQLPIWNALLGIRDVTKDDLNKQLRSADPEMRVWAIRRITDDWPIDTVYGIHPRLATLEPQSVDAWLERLVELASKDPSPAVRRQLASTLCRLPVKRRPELGSLLTARIDDRDDHNLPLLIWYGLMPLINGTPQELIPVLERSAMPTVTRNLARAMAEFSEVFPELLPQSFNALTGSMNLSNKHEIETAFLEGLDAGLVGATSLTPTDRWQTLRSSLMEELDPVADKRLRQIIERIDSLYGGGRPVEELIAASKNQKLEITQRVSALRGLMLRYSRSGTPELEAVLQVALPLLRDARVNLDVAQLLAMVEHPEIAKELLKQYRRFRAPNRLKVIAMLVSRRSYAFELLDAIEAGSLTSDAVSASQLRTLVAIDDAEILRRVKSIWGQVRQSPVDRLKEMDRLKQMLGTERLASGDLSAGRGLFEKSCANCHRMYGRGGTVGPELTGAQRTNIDYWLSNIVDPDAVVGKDYRATQILTVDGRVLVGLVKRRSPRAIELITADATLSIALDDIEAE